MKSCNCRIWLDSGQTIRSSTGVELRVTPSKALEPLALAGNASTLCWHAQTLFQGACLVLPAKPNSTLRLGPESRYASHKRSSSVDRKCQLPSAKASREERHCNATYLSLAFKGLGPKAANRQGIPVILQLVAIDNRTKYVIVTKVIPRLRKALDWKMQVLAVLSAKRAARERNA
ncbi:hypothetical protein D3C76_140280 [compost metagenome]